MGLKNKAGLFVLVLLLSCGCSVEKASQSYRTNHDYESLKILCDQLHKDMPRAKVKELLGEPNYSPKDREYWYSSDQMASYGDYVIPHTLVVTYYYKVEYGDEGVATKCNFMLESFKMYPAEE